jgi:hypothetical protein
LEEDRFHPLIRDARTKRGKRDDPLAALSQAS